MTLTVAGVVFIYVLIKPSRDWECCLGHTAGCLCAVLVQHILKLDSDSWILLWKIVGQILYQVGAILQQKNCTNTNSNNRPDSSLSTFRHRLLDVQSGTLSAGSMGWKYSHHYRADSHLPSRTKRLCSRPRGSLWHPTCPLALQNDNKSQNEQVIMFCWT